MYSKRIPDRKEASYKQIQCIIDEYSKLYFMLLVSAFIYIAYMRVYIYTI